LPLHQVSKLTAVQAAEVEVAASYPGGIDYLVVAAGTIDDDVKPTLELCAAS
jgi:hypothetical protein